MALGLPIFALIVVVLLILRFRSRPKEQRGQIKDNEPTTINLSGVQPCAADFDWRTSEPIAYRPWHNGPYHVTMGIKRTAVQDWIEIDNTYLDKIALKRELFEKQRDVVTQVLPGCEEAAFEGLYLLAEYLPRRYPTMFKWTEKKTIENLATKETWDLTRSARTWNHYHPLEVMALLAPEDFVILQTDPATGVSSLKAGATAGWRMQDRIGHSLWQIHAGRVPQYETKLAKSMDRFFMRMQVGSAITRFNYAIDDSDELYHPHSHHNLSVDKKVRLEDLHLRVERQFLQRLPKTRALLFSIRTYITPITEVTKDKEVAAALRTSVGSFTEDVAGYKNKALWDSVLSEHLKQVLEGEKGVSDS
ncbi:hypothetical protein KCU85_g7216, partial [Aureobasidium melanogenum]